MSFKILKIRKRNWFARIPTVDYYKVTVELENGKVVRVNAWAGIDEPQKGHLVYSVRKKLRKLLFKKKVKKVTTLEEPKKVTEDLTELVGSTFDILSSWEKDQYVRR